jgi:hypothetical protein
MLSCGSMAAYMSAWCAYLLPLLSGQGQLFFLQVCACCMPACGALQLQQHPGMGGEVQLAVATSPFRIGCSALVCAALSCVLATDQAGVYSWFTQLSRLVLCAQETSWHCVHW